MANDPLRRGSQDQGHAEPIHGSTERQHGSTAQGTATISRQQPVREEPPRRPPEPPHRPRISPWVLLGLLGLLALGGLVTGLVVSHNPVRHVVRHIPTPSRPPVGAAGTTLGVLAQRGSGTSQPFTVPASPVNAEIGYQCPAGSTGHFIAKIATTSGSDVQSIVNSSAPTGNKVVTLHPSHPGTSYQVTVTAPSAACGYRVAVAS